VRKRVVEGGPIRFKDDLPIAAAEIPRPLGLPPVALLPDGFIVWYKGRFFELERATGEWYARLWDRRFALREVETAGAREDRYFEEHRGAIEKAQERWLSKVLPGDDPGGAARSWGPQAAQAVRERIEELCAVPLRPPQRDVGKGRIERRSDGSVLGEMQGYERLLLVDGRAYDLLSLAEYLGRFDGAMDPKLLKELQKDSETLAPADVCERMSRNLDRMDKRTYGVIKGKVHEGRRTFELHLDGVYFIPEYLCPGAELLSKHASLVEKRIKIGAVDRLL